jgi:hypothetical protein
MGTTVMTGQIAEVSLRPSARITGIVYFLYFLTAVFGEFFLKGMVVEGDAAATANNILAQQPLFRLGLATGLIATACYIAVTALFYGLFKPVNRSLSLLAAFFGVVGCAITAIGSLFQLAPLVVLGGAQYLSVFNVEQLQALAFMFLKLNTQTANICLVIFGFYDLLIGYLIYRSTFLPRFLGVLMALAGLGPGTRLPRGIIADAMAPREGRERSTMEGASQRSMKTCGLAPRPGAGLSCLRLIE